MRSLMVARSTSGVSCRKPSRYSTGMSPRSASTSSLTVLQAMILKVVMANGAFLSGRAGRDATYRAGPVGRPRERLRYGDAGSYPLIHVRVSDPDMKPLLCIRDRVRPASRGSGLQPRDLVAGSHRGSCCPPRAERRMPYTMGPHIRRSLCGG